jgi:hypothetical protein
VTCGADSDGRIAVPAYPEHAQPRNARRDPKAGTLISSENFGGPWVQVDEDAEVMDMPEAADALVDYYRAIAGEHPVPDEYRRAMIRPDKSLLRITPTSWGPVAIGGFPARIAG